jgi:hypothetical protein
MFMERSSASLWRKINSRYNMVGNECTNCGKAYFPPRLVCKDCGRKSKMQSKKFNGTGEVYSYSKIHVPTDAFKDSAPYTVGIIKLDEGPLVEGHIIDDGKGVNIGMRVKSAFRRMDVDGEEGLIYYHFKFVPE